MELEIFLTNQGLNHIVRNISRFLDVRSLAQCRLVSKSWKELIDNLREWLVLQLVHINCNKKKFIKESKVLKTSIKRNFPEWSDVIEQISRTQNIPTLKEFVQQMWIYFRAEINYAINPLNDAIVKSNALFVQILIDAGIDLTMKNTAGWTSLHFVCRYGSIEIAHMLIKFTLDPTSRTNYGSSIFHLAVQNPNPNVAKLMFSTFKFEDVRDSEGWSIINDASCSFTRTNRNNSILDRIKAKYWSQY